MTKIGRNDPCPCGSGNKFKHCHGVSGAPVLAPVAQPPVSLVGDAPWRDDELAIDDEHAFQFGLRNAVRLLLERGVETPDDVDAVMGSLSPSEVAALFQPATALDEADVLADEAWEARGSKRIKLARRALEISPDSIGAYMALAEEAADPVERLSLYNQAVDAAERTLGQPSPGLDPNDPWSMPGFARFLQARTLRALHVAEMGRVDDGLAELGELMLLDPDELLAGHYPMLLVMTLDQRYTDAEELLEAYPRDDSIQWMFARALLAFALDGDADSARQMLSDALDMYPLVARHLLSPPRFKDLPDPDTFADEDEYGALVYARRWAECWRAAPGALAWLRHATRASAVLLPSPGRLFLDPDPLRMFARCPVCEQRTRHRTFHPVVRYADGTRLVLKEITRYCQGCDVLLIDRRSLEEGIDFTSAQEIIGILGRPYLAVGTLDPVDPLEVEEGVLEDDEWEVRPFREHVRLAAQPWVWVSVPIVEHVPLPIVESDVWQ